MTTAPGEVLEFRRHRRPAAERFVLEAALSTVTTMAGAVVIGSGPVDYLFYSLLAAIAAGIVAVVILPMLLLRLAVYGRVPVTLTADGIHNSPPPRYITWADITSISTVRGSSGRQALLTLRDGGTAKLYAPQGSQWLPDPRFDQELADLQRWATRHGADIHPDRGPRPCLVAALGIGVLVLLAGTGVRAAGRGVIWPSTPTVATVTAACPALQAAGLDQLWPAGTRRLELAEHHRHELGDYSYCWWASRPGSASPAPYRRLTARIQRHNGLYASSPIAMAARQYRSDHAALPGPAPTSIPQLGDQAYISSEPHEVLVEARQANVVVSIQVDLHAQNQEQAEATARALIAAILTDLVPQ